MLDATRTRACTRLEPRYFSRTVGRRRLVATSLAYRTALALTRTQRAPARLRSAQEPVRQGGTHISSLPGARARSGPRVGPACRPGQITLQSGPHGLRRPGNVTRGGARSSNVKVGTALGPHTLNKRAQMMTESSLIECKSFHCGHCTPGSARILGSGQNGLKIRLCGSQQKKA